MRKKILTGLMVLIPIILIGLVILFRSAVSPTNEEIITELKENTCYKTNVDYTFINARGEETINTTLYYDKEKGGKIEFGQDRVKVYKDGKVLVKDNIGNKEYELDKTLDDLHYIAFLNKLLSYPISNEGIKEGQEEWGDRIYIYFTVELFEQNNHVNTAKVFIDKEEGIPIGVIVYDKEGKPSIKIIYKNFETLKHIDDSLL